MFAISSASAQAYTETHYYSQLTPPYSWGAWSYDYYMTGNIASYGGSGSVPVCEEVQSQDTGKVVSLQCGTNAAGQVNDVQAYTDSDLIGRVENGSAYNHTIDGFFFQN